MQSKDIIKSNAPGVLWAIAKGGWVSKSDKAIGKVDRRYCTPVSIIDPGNQYNLSQTYVLGNDGSYLRDSSGDLVREWTVAPSGERSKGFLVEDGAGNRWVVKSSDFVGLWSDKEKEWSAKEQENEKEEQERARRQALQTGEDARIRAVNESIEKDIVRSLTDLLEGAPVSVSLGVEGKWNDDYTSYRATTSGRVTINVDDFQRLLEAVYEAREGVN